MKSILLKIKRRILTFLLPYLAGVLTKYVKERSPVSCSQISALKNCEKEIYWITKTPMPLAKAAKEGKKQSCMI